MLWEWQVRPESQLGLVCEKLCTLLTSNLDLTYIGRRKMQWLFSWTVLLCEDNSQGRVKFRGEVGR